MSGELNRVSPTLPPEEDDNLTKKGKKFAGKFNSEFPEPDYGEELKFDPDFQGPVKNRSCTDVICLLLFLVFLGGWGFVGYFAYDKGDIDKVIIVVVIKLSTMFHHLLSY